MPSDYGVTAVELTELSLLAHELDGAQLSEAASQTAYRASVAFTAATRAPAEILFRALRTDAYTTATDVQLISAGLEPHKKPSKTAPTPPLNLRVTGGADGINSLQWEAGDNTSSTDYVLYTRDSATEPWQLFDVVSTLRAKQSGQMVGKMKMYQVTARRWGIESTPSNVATAFGNG